MKNTIIASALLAVASCTSTPSSKVGELPARMGGFEFKKTFEPMPGFKIHHYHAVRSGLNVYLIPTPGSKVVTPVTAYGVGSRNEIAGRTGLAHLFEHMMFRGTPSYPAPFKTLGDWGGSYNAYTSFDVTVYYETVPKQLLDEALKFEAERMRQLKITEEGYKTERNAVVSERKLNYEDNPIGRLRFEAYQLAYDRHPYKTTPIGWQEDLDATSFQDALDFYKKYYAPNRAQLVLVGDFSINEALESLNRHYGSFVAEPWTEAAIPQEKPRITLRRKVIDAKSENVIMIDSNLGIRFKDPREAVDSLLCDLLSDSDRGFLAQELVEKNHATRAYAMCDAQIDPGLQSTLVSASPGISAEKIEKLYLDAMKKFPAWLTNDKIKKMKNYYLAAQYSSLRNPTELGKDIAHALSATGDVEHNFKLIKEIEGVTREQLLARFRERKRFHPTRLFINPSEKQQPLTREKR